ncbi:MAG: hypothetical protein PHF70_08495 [Opitutales bacterium]|nr:hypothetical protein [Opitutales bacterium]
MAVYYFSVGLIPDLAVSVTTLWLISFFAAPILIIAQIVQMRKWRYLMNSMNIKRVKWYLSVSVLLYLSVWVLQYRIGCCGSWTRVCLNGGSGKVRESMVHMFDKYPVNKQDFSTVEKSDVQDSIGWATRSSRVNMTVFYDEIIVFPDFPFPMRGGMYYLMRNPHDWPRSRPDQIMCEDFGNGLWLVVYDY